VPNRRGGIFAFGANARARRSRSAARSPRSSPFPISTAWPRLRTRRCPSPERMSRRQSAARSSAGGCCSPEAPRSSGGCWAAGRSAPPGPRCMCGCASGKMHSEKRLA